MLLLLPQLAGHSVSSSLTFMALRYHSHRHIMRQPDGVVAGGGVGLCKTVCASLGVSN